jgi:Peptide methionine sulfoxide reductase
LECVQQSVLAPAHYFVDAQGRIRHHHFGEGEYAESERVIQQLLAEAGKPGVAADLVTVKKQPTHLPATAALVAIGIGLTVLQPSAEIAHVIPAPAVDEAAVAQPSEVAVIAGGCFWGVQGVFQHVNGVTNAVSGYAALRSMRKSAALNRPCRIRPHHIRSAQDQLWADSAYLLFGRP